MDEGVISWLTSEQLFWIVLGGVAAIVIIAGIISEYFTARLKTRGKVDQTRAREETRRELAAYVAEGSMTPADAERILVAEPGARRRTTNDAAQA